VEILYQTLYAFECKGGLKGAAATLLASFSALQAGEVETPETRAPQGAEVPEYFLLRPDVEKSYGYTHAM